MEHRRPGLAASSPVVLISLVASALWAFSCGRDHSLGITSGAGGSSSSSSSKASSSHAAASSSSGMIPEPDGPTKLTIVNGVNDYDAIRVCFLPYPDGDPALMPWPGATGLPFAHAAVIGPISPTVPAGKDIQPVVIAGDLTKIAGKTCEDAIALSGSGAGGAGGGDAGGGPPPPTVATPLGVIPANVFTAPRSILLVPFGCLGGPGHDGPNAALGCGKMYSPSSPTADLIVLGMSRIVDPKHLNLQVVNASAALDPSDVRLGSGFNTGTEWLLVHSLGVGSIGPKPPWDGVSVTQVGPLDKATVNTYQPGQSSQTSTTKLPDAIANGALADGDVVDGTGLILIGVGAYPGTDAQEFWHKLTFTLVKADP